MIAFREVDEDYYRAWQKRYHDARFVLSVIYYMFKELVRVFVISTVRVTQQ